MSWSKSFTIPAGAETGEIANLIADTPVDPQPNTGYDAGEHQEQVKRAKDVARILVYTLGHRPGKEIAVSIGGHTPCGEADWGGSLSVSVCHCDPPRPAKG